MKIKLPPKKKPSAKPPFERVHPPQLVVGEKYLVEVEPVDGEERRHAVTSYLQDGRFHEKHRESDHEAAPSFALPEVRKIYRLPELTR